MAAGGGGGGGGGGGARLWKIYTKILEQWTWLKFQQQVCKSFCSGERYMTIMVLLFILSAESGVLECLSSLSYYFPENKYWYFIQLNSSRDNLHVITITWLFKYIENFITKNWKFSDKNSDIFHISAHKTLIVGTCKNRLAEEVLTSTTIYVFEQK